MRNCKLLYLLITALISCSETYADNVYETTETAPISFSFIRDTYQNSIDNSDSLIVMFWNLENFFDWKNGNTSDSDRDFSIKGSRHWTRSRFDVKCNAIAKSVLWIAEKYGHIPDIIAVAEVENKGVLYRLAGTDAMSKCDWGIVHYDSTDPRGIDVGLLYRKSSIRVFSSRPIKVSDEFSTRDILETSFEYTTHSDDRAKILSVLVNHHPSKYGGKSAVWKREAAVMKLKEAGDSLYKAGINDVIALGDFNDTPDNDIYDVLEENGRFFNLTKGLLPQGTIRFQGKWELIDQIFISPSLIPYSRADIVRIPFLMTKDNVYPGEKPLRTYSGPRYSGGVSDHCPIILILRH